MLHCVFSSDFDFSPINIYLKILMNWPGDRKIINATCKFDYQFASEL